jgi:hypothetical protein
MMSNSGRGDHAAAAQMVITWERLGCGKLTKKELPAQLEWQNSHTGSGVPETTGAINTKERVRSE